MNRSDYARIIVENNQRSLGPRLAPRSPRRQEEGETGFQIESLACDQKSGTKISFLPWRSWRLGGLGALFLKATEIRGCNALQACATGGQGGPFQIALRIQ
jgi:hypothetical protein